MFSGCLLGVTAWLYMAVQSSVNSTPPPYTLYISGRVYYNVYFSGVLTSFTTFMTNNNKTGVIFINRFFPVYPVHVLWLQGILFQHLLILPGFLQVFLQVNDTNHTKRMSDSSTRPGMLIKQYLLQLQHLSCVWYQLSW